jgi:hypothetical protein
MLRFLARVAIEMLFFWQKSKMIDPIFVSIEKEFEFKDWANINNLFNIV